MSAVLFDLDGTLVDSRKDLAAGVNALLAEHGLEPLPVEQLLRFVGRGARSLVRRALDAADPAGRVSREDTVLRTFIHHYRAVLLDTTVPYPGVREGLETLQAAGLPMAVVSNKPHELTAEVVEGLGLGRFFGPVLGGDSAARKKPAPDLLLMAAEQLGVSPSDCMMVGDSDVDIAAAAAAGMPALWCSWGGIHPDRPEGVVQEVDEFDQVVARALQRA